MESEELALLKAFSFVQMHDESFVDREIIDLEYKGHVNEICARLQEEKERIHNVMWQFFDALFPIYDEKSTTLHKKWGKYL
jgi:hypothetical protein